jgi:hypothetical protein
VEYYDQYQISASYSTSDSTTPSSSVTLSGTQFGSSSYQLTLTTAVQNPWLDAGTGWSVNNPITSGTQRWDAASGISGTVSSATAIAPSYYHQYDQTLSYVVVDGGSPSAPKATGTSLGAAYAPTLTTTATAYWFDASGSIAISTSTGTNEQWAPSPASVSATQANTQVVSMYNQYKQTLSYVVVDGGSPSAPTATGLSLGSAYAPSLTTTATGYWFDASGSITFSTSTSGSTERWAPSPASVSATQSNTQVVSMYNQYQVTASYSTSDGSTPSSSPILSGTQLGSSTYTLTLTKSAQTTWLDAGTAWSVSNPITSGTQRWDAASGTSGTVSGAVTVNPTYYHQYQLTVTASPSGAIGGTFKITYTQLGTTNSNQQQTTTWTSWADAGSTATVTSYQSPVNGYSFVSYTPSSGSVTMNAAETITLTY